MTPKEKAKELYNKFNPFVAMTDFYGDNVEHRFTKQCALIAVDEILNCYNWPSSELEYYQEVKSEIEKL